MDDNIWFFQSNILYWSRRLTSLTLRGTPRICDSFDIYRIVHDFLHQEENTVVKSDRDGGCISRASIVSNSPLDVNLPLNQFIEAVDFHAHWPGFIFRTVSERGKISSDTVPSQLLSKDVLEIERRIQKMDADGIATEVISFVPGIFIQGKNPTSFPRAIRATNRFLGNIVERYGERFAGLALIPTDNLGVTLDELQTCVLEDKLKGVVPLWSWYRNHSETEEITFYKMIDQLEIPVVIREGSAPEIGTGQNFSKKECFVTSRIFDSCFILFSLIRSEILNLLPSLPVVFSPCRKSSDPAQSPLNSQGNSPNRSYPSVEKLAWEDKVVQPRNDYFKEIYLDTVCSSEIEIEFFSRFIGADHMIFGTDSPYEERGPQISKLKSGRIAERDKNKILRENAARILKLKMS